MKVSSVAQPLAVAGSTHWLSDLLDEAQGVSNALSLTANENRMSSLARLFLSSAFESRYHLGDEGKGTDLLASKGSLLYSKLGSILSLEKQAQEVLQRRLGASASDLRPLSGVHAMLSTLLGLTQPGDEVWTISPQDGGHFATSGILKQSGRSHRYLPWDRREFRIDLRRCSELWKQKPPKFIFLDQGMMLFPLDVARLRECAGPETTIVYDASHPLGLIYGGYFEDPLRNGCDIIQGNTHKTFPGPQKALIAFRSKETAACYEAAVNEGLVSSVHTHHLVALMVTLLEMDVFGASYAEQCLRNAEVLSSALAYYGFKLVHREGIFTRSNVFLIESVPGHSIRAACDLLAEAGIRTNARLFGEKEVLRVGVQELTRLGMREPEMREIARLWSQLFLLQSPAEEVKISTSVLKNRFKDVRYAFGVEEHRMETHPVKMTGPGRQNTYDALSSSPSLWRGGELPASRVQGI